MGKCTFQKLWTYNEKYKDWLFVGVDEHTGFCKACKRSFDISNMGESAVKSHMKGKKHLENINLLQQIQSRLTSASDESGSGLEISIPVQVTLDENASEARNNMIYIEVNRLNKELEDRDKLISTLKAEVRLLQMQVATKDTEVMELAKQNEQLNQQLSDCRNTIGFFEKFNNGPSGSCNARNCVHLGALKEINVQAKTEGISAELKESEYLAEDLHQKLTRVLSNLKALGSSLATIEQKQAPEENCILGISDDDMVTPIEPNGIKMETSEDLPPASSPLISEPNHDVSSSSGTDVHDSLEVILESLPQNSQVDAVMPEVHSKCEAVQEVAESSLIELTCVLCKLNFKFTEEQAAALTTEERKTFKCTVCGKNERRKATKLSNSLPRKSNKIFKCTICNKVFHFPSKLKNHLRTHTGEKPFHCNVCGKSFSLSFNLKIHYRTHSGERPFACETCGKNFRQSKSLLYHNCSHTLRRGHISCKICNKIFEPGAFRGHQCVPAANKQSPYCCTICSKRFPTLILLSAHKLTHREKGLYSCNTCGEAFPLPSDLKSHWCAETYNKVSEGRSTSIVEPNYFPVNSDSQIFKCIICSEAFTDSASLLKHQLIHQSGKPCVSAFPSNHGQKHYSVTAMSSSVSPSSSSSGSSNEKIGPQQVPKDLRTERVAQSESVQHQRQQPEFYDISELAHLKSFSDSSAL